MKYLTLRVPVPEWATCVTTDEDGDVLVRSGRPEPAGDGPWWGHSDGRAEFIANVGPTPNWRDTLVRVADLPPDDEVAALRAEVERQAKEIQGLRSMNASHRIRLSIIGECLDGTYESCWPSNEHECSIADKARGLRATVELAHMNAAALAEALDERRVENERQARRIAELEAALRDIRRQVAQAERGTTHYVGCDMDHPLCWIDGVAARALEAPK